MRIVTAVAIGMVLLAGCGSSPPPADPVPPAPSTAAAAPTTGAVREVQALLDEAGVRADLDRLPKDAPVCTQKPPAPACRDTIARVRSVADRLGAAILASRDPAAGYQLNGYARGLGSTATGIEAYCYGQHGNAVDPTNCRRFVDGIDAFVTLIKFVAVQ